MNSELTSIEKPKKKSAVLKNNLESVLVNLFNKKFNREGINAIAYRIRQAKFSTQFCDVLVDSRLKSYYLAIECKKIKSLHFYFSSYFRKDQIERFTAFITSSGRKGYLVTSYQKKICMIPWEYVINKLNQGYRRISSEELLSWVKNKD